MAGSSEAGHRVWGGKGACQRSHLVCLVVDDFAEGLRHFCEHQQNDHHKHRNPVKHVQPAAGKGVIIVQQELWQGGCCDLITPTVST